LEAISVFDIFKVGIGPSSSHTLGPWRAVQRWLGELSRDVPLAEVERVQIHLYGSLALTGRGHATDKALCLALLGYDPETVPVEEIEHRISALGQEKGLRQAGLKKAKFDPKADILFVEDQQLEGHANAMIFRASIGEHSWSSTYYSVGGGFVVKQGEEVGDGVPTVSLPYPCESAADIQQHCERHGMSIRDMVWANERAWREDADIRRGMLRIWEVMKQCMFRGVSTQGHLPDLQVRRRAYDINQRLLPDGRAQDAETWMQLIRTGSFSFQQVLKWVSVFALAVNEENANLGRVVTAPTNGAAGVIPAVLMYRLSFFDDGFDEDHILDFLMVAGEIGSIFKKRATISAAMGGCQAEIGVSSSMAAAALVESQGGRVEQALMAAEIAMEHHLGMTCDPVGGLVQIPCIERNAMGAIKAIQAAEIALESDPTHAKVSLDEVIATMWQTAQDMSGKYKETSQGGLATNISVVVPEC
jgi:L-serine dehydratase